PARPRTAPQPLDQPVPRDRPDRGAGAVLGPQPGAVGADRTDVVPDRRGRAAAGPPRGDDRTPTERGRLAPAGPAAGRPDAADDERDAPEQALGLPGDSRL